MDLPKCRICGERHRLGGCPSNATKNSRGVPQSPLADGSQLSGSTLGTAKTLRETKSRPEAQKVEQPRKLRGKDAGSIPAGLTKPAKKAKPKKEKKNAASTDRKKNKVGKPNLKRRSKEHRRSELPGNSKTQPIAMEDAGQDLPRSAGDVAQLAASPIRPGHPRKGEEHKTLTATKPWVALKMSRAGWYRNGKPMPETKP